MGRRYAVVIRTAVLVCAGAAALVQASPDQRPTVAGLAAWSALYARLGSRGLSC